LLVGWNYSRVSPDVKFFPGSKIHYFGRLNGMRKATGRFLVEVSFAVLNGVETILMTVRRYRQGPSTFWPRT
jgi:hypothetical protein